MEYITTTAWAFDGSGNNWVSYPKGVNSDGKGIENGLFTTGHTYSAFVKETKYNKAFAYQAGEYTTNYTTDISGYKFLGQFGESVAKAITEVDTTITTKWDAKAAAKAMACQVKTFGKFYHFAMKNASSSKKYEKKMAALNKSLTAAFGTLVNKTDWVALDEIGELVDPSTDKEDSDTADVLAKAKAALTADQWALVEKKASGMTMTAIAAEMGVSKMAISKKFAAIYKAAVAATGKAYVS